jgi:hypothetical protein
MAMEYTVYLEVVRSGMGREKVEFGVQESASQRHQTPPGKAAGDDPACQRARIEPSTQFSCVETGRGQISGRLRRGLAGEWGDESPMPWTRIALESGGDNTHHPKTTPDPPTMTHASLSDDSELQPQTEHVSTRPRVPAAWSYVLKSEYSCSPKLCYPNHVSPAKNARQVVAFSVSQQSAQPDWQRVCLPRRHPLPKRSLRGGISAAWDVVGGFDDEKTGRSNQARFEYHGPSNPCRAWDCTFNSLSCSSFHFESVQRRAPGNDHQG